jgi:hypothetical protein
MVEVCVGVGEDVCVVVSSLSGLYLDWGWMGFV